MNLAVSAGIHQQLNNEEIPPLIQAPEQPTYPSTNIRPNPHLVPQAQGDYQMPNTHVNNFIPQENDAIDRSYNEAVGDTSIAANYPPFEGAAA